MLFVVRVRAKKCYCVAILFHHVTNRHQRCLLQSVAPLSKNHKCQNHCILCKAMRVSVFVRQRPQLDSPHPSVLNFNKGTSSVHIPPNVDGGAARSFKFDGVFDEDATQDEVYQGVVDEATNQVLDGLSSAILCYGPTGSGKSYTCFGKSDSSFGGSRDTARNGSSRS